jgi:bacillithiol biosynthesis cysteine-adding enzyme BshC
MERELLEQFSHRAVAGTVAALQEKQYKVQASGRDINLFYLNGAARERIVATATGFAIHNTDLQFTREAMLEELRLHPERFSPNVILRGILQETVLPNIVFVGGGGELAYWLELKQVFAAAQVPYPVLILRNSFLLVEENIQALLQKTGLTVTDYFQPLPALERMLAEAAAEAPLRLEQELQALQELYGQIGARAGRIALPLQAHVAALQAQAQKKLLALEKKMLRAEKKKHEALIRQAHKIKEALFPRNSLQERVENMAAFYARYGPALFDTLLACSPAVEQQFTIAGLPAKTHSVI